MSSAPRQLWLLPVLLITVIATALGGLVARSLYAEPAPEQAPLVTPSPSAVPPNEQPGSPEVVATPDAMAHPLYGTLQPLLQTYFDSINKKDYGLWSSVVTAERRANQPEEAWRVQYRSTRDGGMVMYRIEAIGDGEARVLLHFTSTQSLEDAPAELPATCIQWDVVWAFSKQRGEWKLAAGLTSASPQLQKC